MTPGTKSRQKFDRKLEQAGSVLQDLKQLDFSAGIGVVSRAYPIPAERVARGAEEPPRGRKSEEAA